MKKVNNIIINQEDGLITVIRDGEEEYRIDINGTLSRIRGGDVSNIVVANWIAEMLHDCLNCKTVSCELHDLNDTRSYFGTYFEWIDKMQRGSPMLTSIIEISIGVLLIIGLIFEDKIVSFEDKIFRKK